MRASIWGGDIKTKETSKCGVIRTHSNDWDSGFEVKWLSSDSWSDKEIICLLIQQSLISDFFFTFTYAPLFLEKAGGENGGLSLKTLS